MAAISKMPKLHIVTYENTNHNHLKHLKRSAQFFGWPEITVIGAGETWEGFGTKIFAYTDYLKTLPGDDIVVLIDARDVLINGTPAQFLERFTPARVLIVSAEFGCCSEGDPVITADDRRWIESYTDNPNRYLNSGMVAGLVSSFQRVYPFGMTKAGEDDQNAMTRYWKDNPEDIILDYDERLFSNATWSPNSNGYTLGNGQWISKSSGGSPIFIQTQAKNWGCYTKLLYLYKFSFIPIHFRKIVVLIVIVLCAIVVFKEMKKYMTTVSAHCNNNNMFVFTQSRRISQTR